MQGERASRFDKGLAVSASVHAALLVSTLVAFSDARRFDEAQEALPVEVVTAAELNQIMRGEKTAKPAEKPATRAEQQADRVESKPEPPTEQASRDVPVPPPPLRREPDPGEAQERTPPVPTPPPAPPRVAAVPPEPQRRPDPPAPPPPPRPEPPKAEAKPERPAPEKAEPVPEPPRRPEPPKPEARPAPPPRPKPPEQKPTEPKPPGPKAAEKPKDDKPRLDQVAKLLEDRKREEHKPAAKPRTGEAEQPPSKYDPANIKRMLSREAPQQTASTGREVSRTASLGTATGRSNDMSPAMWAKMNDIMFQQYRDCWNRLGNEDSGYVPNIEIFLNRDGSLASHPVLLNPPRDPSLKAQADSAMRAVLKCNPLKIPQEFLQYHAKWQQRRLRFDPADM